MSNEKKGIRRVLSAAHHTLRRKQTVAAVFFSLRILVIATMVGPVFNGGF